MVTIAPEPLGGLPEAWQVHESYAWEASAASQEPRGHYAFEPPVLGPLRGWTTCSCGWSSYPGKDDQLLPLTYAEAHRTYIDHLPPGMAAWLTKRQNAPRDNAERITRMRRLVEVTRENGGEALPLVAVEEALGMFR